MHILRTVVNWGWSPILITVLAVAGYLFEWEFWVIVPILLVILVMGMVVAVVRAREKQLELASVRLRQLVGYFSRRFTGNSSLSIFSVISGLFNIDNPQLWGWARACDMSQRIFNTWCSSFTDRLESDIRTRRFDVYLHTYLNELWLVNSHYHEFTEQFYEIAQKIEIPQETKDQYSRFVMEYNSFVESFRTSIAELRQVAKTEIEPPSVKLARELVAVQPFQVSEATQDTQETEVKSPKSSPKSSRESGYYM